VLGMTPRCSNAWRRMSPSGRKRPRDDNPRSGGSRAITDAAGVADVTRALNQWATRLCALPPPQSDLTALASASSSLHPPTSECISACEYSVASTPHHRTEEMLAANRF